MPLRVTALHAIMPYATLIISRFRFVFAAAFSLIRHAIAIYGEDITNVTSHVTDTLIHHEHTAILVVTMLFCHGHFNEYHRRKSLPLPLMLRC